METTTFAPAAPALFCLEAAHHAAMAELDAASKPLRGLFGGSHLSPGEYAAAFARRAAAMKALAEAQDRYFSSPAFRAIDHSTEE